MTSTPCPLYLSLGSILIKLLPATEHTGLHMWYIFPSPLRQGYVSKIELTSKCKANTESGPLEIPMPLVATA